MDGSPNPAPANKKGRLSPPTPKTSLDTKFHTLPKEELRLVLKMPAEAAQDSLKRWYWRASHSRIEEIKELARKIKRHTENIFNTMRYGLSNARNEAVNNKIKVLLRRSYGFRNLESMCSFVMLMCSSLKIPLPNRPRDLCQNPG